AVARREEALESEPLHPRPRDLLRVAGDQRDLGEALQRGEGLRGVRGGVPCARVGAGEQLDVPGREGLAPRVVAAVDRLEVDAGEVEQLARDPAAGLAGVVDAVQRVR